jgi:hypothetical protein
MFFNFNSFVKASINLLVLCNWANAIQFNDKKDDESDYTNLLSTLQLDPMPRTPSNLILDLGLADLQKSIHDLQKSLQPSINKDQLNTSDIFSNILSMDSITEGVESSVRDIVREELEQRHSFLEVLIKQAKEKLLRTPSNSQPNSDPPQQTLAEQLEDVVSSKANEECQEEFIYVDMYGALLFTKKLANPASFYGGQSPAHKSHKRRFEICQERYVSQCASFRSQEKEAAAHRKVILNEKYAAYKQKDDMLISKFDSDEPMTANIKNAFEFLAYPEARELCKNELTTGTVINNLKVATYITVAIELVILFGFVYFYWSSVSALVSLPKNRTLADEFTGSQADLKFLLYVKAGLLFIVVLFFGSFWRNNWPRFVLDVCHIILVALVVIAQTSADETAMNLLGFHVFASIGLKMLEGASAGLFGGDLERHLNSIFEITRSYRGKKKPYDGKNTIKHLIVVFLCIAILALFYYHWGTVMYQFAHGIPELLRGLGYSEDRYLDQGNTLTHDFVEAMQSVCGPGVSEEEKASWCDVVVSLAQGDAVNTLVRSLDSQNKLDDGHEGQKDFAKDYGKFLQNRKEIRESLFKLEYSKKDELTELGIAFASSQELSQVNPVTFSVNKLLNQLGRQNEENFKQRLQDLEEFTKLIIGLSEEVQDELRQDFAEHGLTEELKKKIRSRDNGPVVI